MMQFQVEARDGHTFLIEAPSCQAAARGFLNLTGCVPQALTRLAPNRTGTERIDVAGGCEACDTFLFGDEVAATDEDGGAFCAVCLKQAEEAGQAQVLAGETTQ